MLIFGRGRECGDQKKEKKKGEEKMEDRRSRMELFYTREHFYVLHTYYPFPSLYFRSMLRLSLATCALASLLLAVAAWLDSRTDGFTLEEEEEEEEPPELPSSLSW